MAGDKRFNQDALNDMIDEETRRNITYFGEERRKSGGALEEQIAEALHKTDLILRELIAINRAFPDGPEAHRLFHEQLIKSAKAQEEFWHTAKVELVKKGVAGALAIVMFVLALAVFGAAIKLGVRIESLFGGFK